MIGKASVKGFSREKNSTINSNGLLLVNRGEFTTLSTISVKAHSYIAAISL